MELERRVEQSFSQRSPRRALAVTALLCAMGGLALTAVPAAARGAKSGPRARASLVPPPGKVFFGATDTGDSAQFGEFTTALDKHPAVIETFRSWGSDFPESIQRWQAARARPMLHITTADPNDGHELISPRGIAYGHGDGYLIRLNRLFWKKKMRAYIRPLGEPNRCRNVYASYDCSGHLRDSAHKPRWLRLAFRRVFIVVRGGGKRRQINARLRAAGLPHLRSHLGGLPKAPVELIWSPLPAGSPTVPHNRPRHFYPGSDYVDWAGTDFYSDNQDWRALTGLYNRFKGKPFAITEWSVLAGDDSRFVKRLLVWLQRHPRCRMLVYYQDFGPVSTYRLQNYPASLSLLRRRLHSPRFPSFAPFPPKAPPPPPGGITPVAHR